VRDWEGSVVYFDVDLIPDAEEEGVVIVDVEPIELTVILLIGIRETQH
jgi:hypothetical protein